LCSFFVLSRQIVETINNLLDLPAFPFFSPPILQTLGVFQRRSGTSLHHATPPFLQYIALCRGFFANPLRSLQPQAKIFFTCLSGRMLKCIFLSGSFALPDQFLLPRASFTRGGTVYSFLRSKIPIWESGDGCVFLSSVFFEYTQLFWLD